MSVTIILHKTHRQFTDGKKMVQVDGNTVGDCISDLIRIYPPMQSALFARNGKLKNNIEIYVNMESAYPDELAKAVRNGDEIHITLILTGG